LERAIAVQRCDRLGLPDALDRGWKGSAIAVLGLSHNLKNSFHCGLMDTTQKISTQVTLPIAVYQAIAQRAQAYGQSVDSEIVTLLISLLEDSAELAQEFADWEAASDEDWLNLEVALSAQEN
jgi:hypothetical protein